MNLSLRSVYEAVVGTNVNAEKSVNPGQGQALIDKYKDKLVAKGMNVGSAFVKRLGRGKMGIAYDLGDNTVMKITGDASEARAAKHLVGKNLKHVYKVFNVFQFDKTGFFVIHQEKLQPMPADPTGQQDIDRVVQEAISMYRNEEGADAIHAYLTDQMSHDPARGQEVIKLVDDMMAGMKEIKSQGISFVDYHLGNVLYDSTSKNYKFIDLGVSRSAAADIETIE
jgi:serine/threonine protein kinase